MMQLLRGGRIEQLTGIQPARNFDHGRAMILRPWLDISKADLIAFAHERSVKWFEDVTNHQEGTLRNRFRNRYIPELLQDPGTAAGKSGSGRPCTGLPIATGRLAGDQKRLPG